MKIYWLLWNFSCNPMIFYLAEQQIVYQPWRPWNKRCNSSKNASTIHQQSSKTNKNCTNLHFSEHLTASIFVGTLRCISTSANKDTSFNQIHHKTQLHLVWPRLCRWQTSKPKNNNSFWNSNKTTNILILPRGWEAKSSWDEMWYVQIYNTRSIFFILMVIFWCGCLYFRECISLKLRGIRKPSRI